MRNWLLVFDNADQIEALHDYWPISITGSILVTSRDPLSRSTPPLAALDIDLEPFEDKESAILLQRLCVGTGKIKP